MAELRSSTSIGGNLVWHSGNLRFDTQGETIRYSGHKIFTEHDTPTPSELGDGLGGSAYTKDEANATFAPLAGGGYVQLTGDTMTGKLTTSANDIEITGTSPRLTLTDTTDSKKWFAIVDSTKFSIREDNTSTTRLLLDTANININVENFQLNSKTAIRGYDSWLRINDQSTFTSGIYHGGSIVRTDGQFQVGNNGDNFQVSSTVHEYNGNAVIDVGGGTWSGNHTWSGDHVFDGTIRANSGFIPSSSNNGDLNNMIHSGWTTYNTSTANTPDPSLFGTVMTSRYNDSNISQLSFGNYGSGDIRITHRRSESGTWGSWIALINEAGGTWSGNHTWSGTTTFNNNVTCGATPTASTHLTNKAYVDSKGVDLTGDYLWTGNHTFDAVVRPRIVSGSDLAPGGSLAANSAYDGIGIGDIANDVDYPTQYGALLNVQDHVNRGFQLAGGYGGLGGQQDHELWFRRIHSNMTNGYSDWVQLIHSGGGSWGGNHTWSGDITIGAANDYRTFIYGGLYMSDYTTPADNGGCMYYQDGAWEFRGGSGNGSTTTTTTRMKIRGATATAYVPLSVEANGYWGMATPDGDNSTWIRTTSSGIIPSTSGSSSSLGTSSWRFADMYATNANLSGALTMSGNAYTRYGPNTRWGHYLRIGGDGRTSTTDSTIACTTENLHIDSANGGDLYLNYYAGGNIIASDESSGSVLRTGGVNGGYFFNDTGTRTAYTGGDFYIQTGVPNTYIYSPNIYFGNTSGTTVSLRGNALTHNNWNITSSGVGTWNNTQTFNGRVNIRGHLDLSDNEYIYFGSGDDIRFFFNGSHFYTDLAGTSGNWYIRDGSTTRFTFDDAGHFTATGNVTAYSDIRLKRNITPIPDALNKVCQLSGYTYDKASDLTTDAKVTRETGVIAQEVEKVLPEAVMVDENDPEQIKSVAYGNMVGLLIEAVKEQQTEINQLKDRLNKPWWKKIFY